MSREPCAADQFASRGYVAYLTPLDEVCHDLLSPEPTDAVPLKSASRGDLQFPWRRNGECTAYHDAMYDALWKSTAHCENYNSSVANPD